MTALVVSRDFVAVPQTGERAHYARTQVRIEEVISGKVDELAPGELTLELYIPDPAGLTEMAAAVPQERTVFFLVREPKDYAGYYSLINPTESYLRDFGDTAAPVGAEVPWVRALETVTFATALALVRAAVPGS
ncbi:MAG: hypothetical protein H0V12_08140 [Chloroflexi bacterium]|nr:hypothetical protein [Chloroflexota bacterium]